MGEVAGGRFVGDPVDRFWHRVAPVQDACWLWRGSLRADGYGRVYDGERYVPAHRFAYELLIGPIPDGLQLDHLCRNRACVNPAHLEPVTIAENVRRGFAARPPITHCHLGHEFTAENTYLFRTSRHCRACIRIRKERAREVVR